MSYFNLFVSPLQDLLDKRKGAVTDKEVSA